MPSLMDILRHLRRALSSNPPLATSSFPQLPRQTVLITGANTGLGYALAQYLLSHATPPARLILAVRSLDKGEAARTALLAASSSNNNNNNNNTTTDIQLHHLDLQSFASVRDFAQALAATNTTIDVAVLNAGIMTPVNNVSEPDGWESNIQTNYLSACYLSLLLLPTLSGAKKRTGARGVLSIVGSDGHYLTPSLPPFSSSSSSSSSSAANANTPPPPPPPPLLAHYNTAANFAGTGQYGLSKLFVVFFIRSLAARVSADKVLVDCCNPGTVKTELARSSPRAVAVYYALFARTVENARRSLVHAAWVAGEEAHGGFLTECRVAEPSRWVLGEMGEARGRGLWSEMVAVLRPFGGLEGLEEELLLE